MKKVLAIVAVVALVGSFASCNKKCHCKTYVGGAVSATTEIEPGDNMKCSDYNTIAEVNGIKAGTECK